jgi:hypothetical protein
MKTILETIQKDGATKVGLILLTISLTIFLGTWNVYAIDWDIFSGSFFVAFGIVWLYAFIVGMNNIESYGKFFRFRNFTHNIILLQLFNLSAYMLNRSLPVFNESTQWLTAFLAISNVLLLFHSLRKKHTSHLLSYAILASSSISVIFHFYESIYVMMLYPIALIGFFFFGISLHAFVPILMTIAHIKVIRGF